MLSRQQYISQGFDEFQPYEQYVMMIKRNRSTQQGYASNYSNAGYVQVGNNKWIKSSTDSLDKPITISQLNQMKKAGIPGIRAGMSVRDAQEAITKFNDSVEKQDEVYWWASRLVNDEQNKPQTDLEWDITKSPAYSRIPKEIYPNVMDAYDLIKEITAKRNEFAQQGLSREEALSEFAKNKKYPRELIQSAVTDSLDSSGNPLFLASSEKAKRQAEESAKQTEINMQRQNAGSPAAQKMGNVLGWITPGAREVKTTKKLIPKIAPSVQKFTQAPAKEKVKSIASVLFPQYGVARKIVNAVRKPGVIKTVGNFFKGLFQG